MLSTLVPARSPTTTVSAPSSARMSMRSTSTSRLAPTGAAISVSVPLAEIPIVSPTFDPTRRRVSKSVPPWMGRAVAVVPDEQVVAGAQQSDVVARSAGDRVIAIVAGQIVIVCAAVDDIVAFAGNQRVGAGRALENIVVGAAKQHVGVDAADDGVVAGAAIQVDRSGARQQLRTIDGVVPAQGVEGDAILARLGPGNSHRYGSPVIRTHRGDIDLVIAVGAVDRDGVEREIATPRSIDTSLSRCRTGRSR